MLSVYALICHAIKASKEDIAVGYGYFRAKNSLSPLDDLLIGLTFLKNNDIDLALKWNKLIKKRIPEALEPDLALHFIQDIKDKGTSISYDYLERILKEPPTHKNHFFLLPYLAFQCLEKKDFKLFFSTIPLIQEEKEIFNALHRDIKEWLQHCHDINQLNDFVTLGLQSNNKLSQSFIGLAFMKYLNLKDEIDIDLVKHFLGDPETYHKDFAKKIFYLFLERGLPEDAKQLITNTFNQAEKYYLQAFIYSHMGFWTQAISEIEKYLAEKDIEVSDHLLSMIQRCSIAAYGPEYAIGLYTKLLKIKPELISLKLYIAHLTSTYFSHSDALNLLKPHLDNPSFVLKYLNIRSNIATSDEQVKSLYDDWEKAIKAFPLSKALVSHYLDYSQKNLSGSRGLVMAKEMLDLNTSSLTQHNKSAIELCVMKNVNEAEITNYLIQQLKKEPHQWREKIWIAYQLLKLHQQHLVRDYFKTITLPLSSSSKLIQDYESLFSSIGLQFHHHKEIDEYKEISINFETLKTSSSLAFEGKLEESLLLLEQLRKASFDDKDIQLTEYLIEISKNNYPQIKEQLLELIGNHHSPELFNRSIYPLFELSDHEHLLTTIEQVLKKFPNYSLAKCFKAKCLIALNQTSEAKAFINELNLTEHPLVSELKQWANSNNGEIDIAKKIYTYFSNQHYKPWTKASVEGLHQIDQNPLPQKGQIVVFAVFKDEEMRVESFLKHYRKLGVDHFIIVDNGSSDKTIELLSNYSDINIFSISDNYVAASYGMRWINYLADQYAQENWRIVADADEFLVFPHCETLNLKQLCGYLSHHDYEVVRGFMLDMIPEKLSDLRSYSSGDDPVNVSGYFDQTHRKVSLSECPYQTVVGGSRHRIIFGNTLYSRQPLCKTVLIKGGRGIHHTLANHHSTPAKVADLSTVFLHYKFLVDWQKRGDDLANNIAHGPYAGVLKQYSNFSKNMTDQSLLTEDSVNYVNSKQLLDLGLISEGNFNLEN